MNAIVQVLRFWPSLKRVASLLLLPEPWGLNSSTSTHWPYSQPRTQTLLFTFIFLVPRNKIECANEFNLSFIPWNGNKISIFTDMKAKYQSWGHSSMMQPLPNLSKAWGLILNTMKMKQNEMIAGQW